MRVPLLFLVVLATILTIAERRLSDGGPNGPPDPIPPLWEPADHRESGRGTSAALNCPLVVSLERSSLYLLTSAEDGVRFDIDADGDLDQVGWTVSGSDVAFLALDQDGDGTIANGRELIGSHTLPRARNGPNALAMLANDAAPGERRGVIDGRNPLFFKLLLWTDTNHNAISEPEELKSAEKAVSSVGLGFTPQHRKDRHGNVSRFRGFVHIRTTAENQVIRTADEDNERRRSMYDACVVTER
jgi:hypothetical protein